MIQRRSIAMCIILSLVTCGIYGIYWFVVLTDDANTLLPDNKGLNNTSGGILAFTRNMWNIWSLLGL